MTKKTNLAASVGFPQNIFLSKEAMRRQDDHIEHVWHPGQKVEEAHRIWCFQ